LGAERLVGSPVQGRFVLRELSSYPDLAEPLTLGTIARSSFQTPSHETHTLEHKGDRRTPIWLLHRTLTGSAAQMLCLMRRSNTTRRFFRVCQP
jgi:hypothetical protein